MEILTKIHENFAARARRAVGTASLVSTTQCYGLDKDPFAVELAKVTVMLGKRLALAEIEDNWFPDRDELPFTFEDPLPLDNLDTNIRCDDALFCDWPHADYIIGNPPYQSKNKMVQEFGREYVDQVRAEFPEVSGRADYCVFWLRKAHDELPQNGRAGLVGTNTIRQTYSRRGGLDYIVQNRGTVTEAVSTQVWSGDAVVHVSIVNWIKGTQSGKKKLFVQEGDNRDSPWRVYELDTIGAALSPEFDVTKAIALKANADSEICYQGQTHGHSGFLLTREQASQIKSDPSSIRCVHPYLTGDELLSEPDGRPKRHVIDLNHCPDLLSAKKHKAAYQHVEQHVMPDILAKAEEEHRKTRKETGPRQSHARHWWKFWRGRREMVKCVSGLPRYIACSRVTKRPIFAFIDSSIRPNDALQVFPVADDYSFGVLQSGLHWHWFAERCSTLKGDPRYTSNTVFDSFPWPQNPTLSQVNAVASAAHRLRNLRTRLLHEHSGNLRDLYRTTEVPGHNPLNVAHNTLDTAVRSAYRMSPSDSVLQVLFELNQQLAQAEEDARPVIAPGLPPHVTSPSRLITDDAVQPPV